MGLLASATSGDTWWGVGPLGVTAAKIVRAWWSLDRPTRSGLAKVFDGPLSSGQVQRLREADLPVTSFAGDGVTAQWFMGPTLIGYLGELQIRATMDPLDRQLLDWRDADWMDESRPGYAQIPGSSELVLVFTYSDDTYHMGWLRIRASGTATSAVTPVADGSFQECLDALHAAAFES
jgi:hypothetical protein